MKKCLQYVWYLLCFTLFSLESFAQPCSTPISISGVAVASETCPGSGVVAVSAINPTPLSLLTGEAYEYMLVKAEDSSMVKNWQPSDTFSGAIVHGDYLIMARVQCASAVSFSDTVWTSTPITVDSNLNYARILGVNVDQRSFELCETGVVTVSALGRAPLNYALVSGFQNAIILSPRQTLNVFDSLSVGRHFVRVWDSCEGFDTYEFTVGSLNSVPSFGGFSFYKYGCDSFIVNYNITNVYNRPGTTDTALVRNWIKWPNGATDTITLPSGANAITANLNKSFGFEEFNNVVDPNLPFPQNIGTGNKVFTFGFRDPCGVVTEVVRNIEPTPLQIAYSFTDQGCDSLNYTFSATYRPTPGSNIAFDPNGGVYFNSEAFYTLDSGATWQSVTSDPDFINSFGLIILHRDSTVHFGFAYCLDTVFTTLDPRARDTLSQTGVFGVFNNTNVCQGAISIVPALDALIGPGLTVEILWSDPPTALPSPVYVTTGNVQNITLPFGRYAVLVSDSTGVLCPRSYIDTIELQQQPLNFALGVYNVRSCINTAGIVLKLEPGYGANNRNVWVEVITQPTNSTVPNTFTWRVPTNGDAAPSYLRNNTVACVSPGNYTFVFTDSVGLPASCHRIDTLSITVAENRTFQNKIEIINECNGGLVVTRTGGKTYRDDGAEVYPVPSTFQFEMYNSSNTLIFNGQGVPHASNQFYVDFPIPPTLVDALTNGVYTIRCYYTNIREIALPYDTDSCTSTYITWEKGLPRIDPSASIFVEGCDANTAEAMIVGVAKGNYKAPLTWSLSQNGVIVAGPQSSNVFPNLLANQVYTIIAEDVCGVSQNFLASITTTLRLFATSNTNQACPGDDVTLSVDQIPDAEYIWYKDNVVIPGADSHILFLENITVADDSGVYTATANLFNECTLSTVAFELLVDCDPLPIHLGKFDAVRRKDHIALSWNTLSETSNKGFYIQKSNDGRTWGNIGYQPSKAPNGQSSVALQYQYQDSKPFMGANFYRIKQVDFNGDAEYSPIKSVLWTDEASTAITIYPNPATDVLHIKGLKGNETLRVYDVMGRMLMLLHAEGKSELQLPLEKYIDGAYHIHIQNEKDIQFYPFLKQHKK